MTVPNSGPQQPDPTRGNPALVYRDEVATGGVAAATIRATTVSHRFDGARHPLTRFDRFPRPEPHPNDGGDPDASH